MTDNGNFIIDWHFDKVLDWRSVGKDLNDIPGVIEHGLFIGQAKVAFFGNEDGTVSTRKSN